MFAASCEEKVDHMINSFYTAATGAVQLKYGVDVIANNIANVSNNGYKSSSMSFADLVYTNVRDPEGTDSDLSVGHGTKLEKTNISFEQGTLQSTGNLSDFALTGDGFFAVQTKDGVQYTRTGSGQLTEGIDGQFYLTSTLGGLLLDENYQPIVVTDLDTQKIELGVFDFENEDGLLRSGSNFFVPSDTSGAITTMDTEVKQGYLEASSVDVAQEMSSLIEYQRAFQFSSKMVQMSDEVMQTINNLR